MRDLFRSDKGVVLLVVLAVILIAIILANVVLTITFSQTRLTHHQVSRIQAYYAAMAGINTALYNLSAGNWNSGSCNPSCVISDTALPGSINSSSINVYLRSNGGAGPPGTTQCSPPSGSSICIYSVVNYTYATSS